MRIDIRTAIDREFLALLAGLIVAGYICLYSKVVNLW